MHAARAPLWWACSLALLLSLAYDPTAGALPALASSLLAVRAILAAGASRRRATLTSAMVVAAAFLALLLPGPPHARVAFAALGAQALLVGVLRPEAPRRAALAVMGHALALTGTAVVLARRDPLSAASGLAHAAGFGLLAMHAHWTQRQADPERHEGWDVAVMGAIVLGVCAVTLVYAGEIGLLAPPEGLAARGALLAAVGAAAFLCAPPPAPRALRERRGIALDVMAHGAASMALLNILFLSFSLVSWWSLKVVFATLFAWQMVVVLVEFRTIRHAERRRRRGKPLEVQRALREPITVVVPAANEAGVLPGTLAQNLAVRAPLRFVVVPASKSKDDTVRVAHDFARRHPGRVRVVEGTTGSKAEDLNAAWRSIDTKYVLMLDADETIDEASLARAVAVLEARPEVGVVQGRKVSRAPGEGPLARFISAERRYSTWMDHVMHGEDLGSAHFGGSAALMRREVPVSLGGWTDRTMTEDIEFTLRIHLDDRWKIAYLPEMIVREADPQDLGQLLKQRTRWARGWAQCFALYFPSIVRAAKRLGPRRAFGLILLLTISMSALWTTFVPASLLLRFTGVSPLMPVAIALPLTLILLPGRLLAYGYAAFRDPVIPLEATPKRAAELALHAYLWIIMGWFVQLHALYLEASGSARVWYVTAKKGIAT